MRKVILIILFLSGTVFSQISPGELTNAHAKFEGISNCTLCHTLGEKLTNQNCLSCHKEIKHEIDLGHGYHFSSEVKSKDCWKCHSEHNGRNFEIIRFNKKEFDHKNTSFNLTGKHKELECSKCHQSRYIKDAEIKKRVNTFLGLDQKCRSCHDDYHQNTLGDNCISCHDSDNFKPAKFFDHNKTRYQLNGAHLKVECDKCHIKEIRAEKTFQKFKGLSFNSCNDCHKDPHTGKFGNNCEKCHNTSGFQNINKKNFNHDETSFSLIGKHSTVECNKCHKVDFKTKLNYKKCNDCHNDYHEKQFDLTKDCKECHNENGFSPSLYTVDEHLTSKYPLVGSHLAVPCISCHQLNKKWNFKVGFADCTNCHKNVHGDELSTGIMKDDGCTYCHNTLAWNNVNFSHDATKFKLLGKHSIVKCIDCHLKNQFPDISKILFKSAKADCSNCHKDIHHGQFVKNYQNDCGICHGFDKWKAEKFDHNKTKFSLTGAHVNLACEKCHKLASINEITFTIYVLGKYKCADCHS